MSNLKNELHHIPCLPGCGDFGRISTCPVCLLKAEWQWLQDDNAAKIRLAKHHRDLWVNFAETCKALTAERNELRTQNFDMHAELKSLREDNTLKIDEIGVLCTAYIALRARLYSIREIVSEEN